MGSSDPASSDVFGQLRSGHFPVLWVGALAISQSSIALATFSRTSFTGATNRFLSHGKLHSDRDYPKRGLSMRGNGPGHW